MNMEPNISARSPEIEPKENILLGVLGSYIFALIVDPAERASVAAAVSSAKWFGLPIFWKNSVFHLFAGPVDSGVLWSAVLTVVPLSLATMVEHIGDICAISSTCGKNFMVDPGFHRTLLGDGLATTLASLFGAPANTTYGENTGVLALSRIYDPRVIRIAACIAIVVSFCPKFAALVSAMPTATIGGVSLVLYGMISAVGVRNVVENKVDFTNTRNVIIAALILVLAIGITYSGSIQIGVVSLSGLAVSSIVGILLNAILPGKDYTFEQDDKGATSVDFKVCARIETRYAPAAAAQSCGGLLFFPSPWGVIVKFVAGFFQKISCSFEKNALS